MSIGNFSNVETIQERLEKDLKYIDKDIVCKLYDNKDEYCKFSKSLNAVTVLSFTEDTYIKYWTQAYMKYSKEKQLIINACKNKLHSKLTSRQDMLQLVQNSSDHTLDRERMIKILKGEPVEKPLTQSESKKKRQLEIFSMKEELNDE